MRALRSLRVNGARYPVNRYARAYSQSNIDKYREKLLKKAESEGVENIEQLKDKYKQVIEKHKIEFNKVDPLQILNKSEFKSNEVDERSTEINKVRGLRSVDLPKTDIKDLNSFIDVSKLSLHDNKEIELIWKARFANKERTFCGSVNGVTFSRIYKNIRQNPSFVLPLPHEDQGAELHFVQWAMPGPHTLHCMITSLAEYKLHQEYARPHTTMMFHSELLDSKQLVLMNGSIDHDSAVTHEQGVLLSLNVQRFYGADESTATGYRKVQMLKDFTANSPEFSAEALILETEVLD